MLIVVFRQVGPGNKPTRKTYTKYIFLFQISSIFPELQFGNFRIYWIDELDELISFSSDMELAAALDNVRNGLLNLTVKVKY